jgi:hypothetical protein
MMIRAGLSFVNGLQSIRTPQMFNLLNLDTSLRIGQSRGGSEQTQFIN